MRRLGWLITLAAWVALSAGCKDDGGDGEASTSDFDILDPFGQGETESAPEVSAGEVVGSVCCETDADCAEGLRCVRGPGSTAGDCLAGPGDGVTCWAPADCPQNRPCVGAVLCDCGPCEAGPIPGQCDTSCCETDDDCPDESVCLEVDGKRQCNRVPVGNGCWLNSDCPTNECLGGHPCACGEECTPANTPGACKLLVENECVSDNDCVGGSCKAGGDCDAECPAGDPSCCNGNVCVPVVNACVTDDDCPDTGVCVAGEICYPWCEVGDPSCCFGNTCFVDLCAQASPQGCLYTGCPAGQGCVVDDTCVPTSCSCDPVGGWTCTADCVGGTCKSTACIGPNPQGCQGAGCPEGKKCTVTAACVPSGCTCDENSAAWVCTPDCGGGVCQ